MDLLIQDAVVTLAALGAVVILLRRVAGIVRPAKDTPGCAGCSSCAPRPGRVEDAPIPVASLRARPR